MRYYNNKYQMSDGALSAMLKHLHHNRGIVEERCIYTKLNGEVDPKRIQWPANQKIELFVCAHGLRGLAGVSNLGDDPPAGLERKELTGIALAHKIHALGIPTGRQLVVKLPFCYGALKMPSITGFVQQQKGIWGNKGVELTFEIDSVEGKLKGLKSAIRGGQAIGGQEFEDIRDDVLGQQKKVFEPKITEAQQKIAAAQWSVTEQDGEGFNVSLAHVVAMRLGQLRYDVIAGGYKHPMTYSYSKGWVRTKHNKPHVEMQKNAFDDPDMTTVLNYEVKRFQIVHKSYVNPDGNEVSQSESVGKRFCFFPFHFDVKEVPDRKAPPYNNSYKAFYGG